ncbi:MAG TPA: winged helix-turn-helix domain-containing protein [Clostridia bacterium]|nr:winged helix-turn-helix domain-containing protein [Clostridia bacterium]
MPLDIESNIDTANVSVSFSRTIELVCALKYMASKQSLELVDQDTEILYNSLTQKSRETVGIVAHMRLKGLEMQEFVLREKMFDDVELLIKRIKGYDKVNFIYTFIGEELSIENIQTLCGDTEALRKLLSGTENKISNDLEVLKYLFHETEKFRNSMLELLHELNNKHFDSLIRNQSTYYSSLTDQVEEKMEGKSPLDFSQEFYGKKFKRIYDFKDYLFIPSYFLRPNKIRFFNFNTQIIIFSMDNDNLKRLEAGDRISNVLKVVSDRTRLEILRELTSGPDYGKTLAEKLRLTTSTISHHLDQLKEVGLVTEERIKNIKYFNVNKKEVEKVLKEFKEYLTGK